MVTMGDGTGCEGTSTTLLLRHGGLGSKDLHNSLASIPVSPEGKMTKKGLHHNSSIVLECSASFLSPTRTTPRRTSFGGNGERNNSSRKLSRRNTVEDSRGTSLSPTTSTTRTTATAVAGTPTPIPASPSASPGEQLRRQFLRRNSLGGGISLSPNLSPSAGAIAAAVVNGGNELRRQFLRRGSSQFSSNNNSDHNSTSGSSSHHRRYHHNHRYPHRTHSNLSVSFGSTPSFEDCENNNNNSAQSSLIIEYFPPPENYVTESERDDYYYTKDDLANFERDSQLTLLQFRSMREKGIQWEETEHSLRGLEEYAFTAKLKNRRQVRKEHIEAILQEHRRLKQAGISIEHAEESLRELSMQLSKQDMSRAIALASKDAKDAGHSLNGRQLLMRKLRDLSQRSLWRATLMYPTDSSSETGGSSKRLGSNVNDSRRSLMSSDDCPNSSKNTLNDGSDHDITTIATCSNNHDHDASCAADSCSSNGNHNYNIGSSTPCKNPTKRIQHNWPSNFPGLG